MGGGGASDLSSLTGNLRGFTLAEVLITLGIIGIVAAMTLPALIQKNNNKVVETRLKKFYSAINQAILMAENDYGDKKIWYEELPGADIDEEGNPIENSSKAEAWFKKYFIPYLKITRMETTDEGALMVYFPDGSALYTAYTANNRDWRFYPGNVNKCLKEHSPKGKCVFMFNFFPASKSELWKYHYNKGMEPYKYAWDGQIDTLYKDSSYGCNSSTASSHLYCTAVIQMNGWKIPDDYPFKVSY